MFAKPIPHRKRRTIFYSMVRLFVVWLSVRLAAFGARQINHPLCGCATQVIPKKLQTRYNKGVQAYCKAKGEKIWHKRHIVYHIQSGYVNTTLSSPLSIDEKSSIINIGVVWVKYFVDYAVIKVSKSSRDILCRIMFICWLVFLQESVFQVSWGI